MPLDVDVVLEGHLDGLVEGQNLGAARFLTGKGNLVARKGGGDGNGGQRKRAANQHDGGLEPVIEAH